MNDQVEKYTDDKRNPFENLLLEVLLTVFFVAILIFTFMVLFKK